MTKIVTYLRNSTTQYDMKIRMKSESAKKLSLPSTAAAVNHADTEFIGHDGQPGDTEFLCNGTIWWGSQISILNGSVKYFV